MVNLNISSFMMFDNVETARSVGQAIDLLVSAHNPQTHSISIREFVDGHSSSVPLYPVIKRGVSGCQEVETRVRSMVGAFNDNEDLNVSLDAAEVYSTVKHLDEVTSTYVIDFVSLRNILVDAGVDEKVAGEQIQSAYAQVLSNEAVREAGLALRTKKR